MSTETPQSNLQTPLDLIPPRRTFVQKILIFFSIFSLFGLILIVLWQGAEVFLLIFAGLLLAIFLRSLSDFLSRHTPLSNNWSLTVVLLAIVALVALGVWLLSESMGQQFEELSEQLPTAFEQARQKITQYQIGRRIVEQIPSPQQLTERQTGNLFGRLTGFFSTAFNVVVYVLVILITGIYFAFNPRIYREGVVKLVPKEREKRAREILSTVEYTLRRFLLGIFAAMTINGAITTVGLWILGVPFAIPLGVLTGLFNFIPNIGPITASVPAILIAFSQSPTQALYVALLYLAVQNIDGFVTTPLVQQRAVSIPPVLVIGSQLLLAVLFGFLGLLLSVPIVAALFVVVKMIYVEDVLGRRVEVKGEEEAKEETGANQSEV
ncbi:MAG TPA: AI-2E family transporter [Pyrinomonadaceae bacterium]|nr:AI-2E family transporter [Pyrinomonadaceae bacterium]